MSKQRRQVGHQSGSCGRRTNDTADIASMQPQHTGAPQYTDTATIYILHTYSACAHHQRTRHTVNLNLLNTQHVPLTCCRLTAARSPTSSNSSAASLGADTTR
jgi:hypothetical protein